MQVEEASRAFLKVRESLGPAFAFTLHPVFPKFARTRLSDVRPSSRHLAPCPSLLSAFPATHPPTLSPPSLSRAE